MNQPENNQFALAQTGGFGYNNFDPASIQEEDAILCCIAMDISPSVQPFEADLNTAFKEFIEEMQKSHVANKLMVKTLEFNEDVKSKTGFQPIGLVDVNAFVFKATGNSTALVDGAFQSLKDTMDYREQLEKTGINVKVLVFVITDGQDNSSKRDFDDVKSYIGNLMKEERNVFAVETILFGIGDPNSFTSAQQRLGFKHLAVVGSTAKEIRKMIGFISASVSRSSANQAITF